MGLFFAVCYLWLCHCQLCALAMAVSWQVFCLPVCLCSHFLTKSLMYIRHISPFYLGGSTPVHMRVSYFLFVILVVFSFLFHCGYQQTQSARLRNICCSTPKLSEQKQSHQKQNQEQSQHKQNQEQDLSKKILHMCWSDIIMFQEKVSSGKTFQLGYLWCFRLISW